MGNLSPESLLASPHEDDDEHVNAVSLRDPSPRATRRAKKLSNTWLWEGLSLTSSGITLVVMLVTLGVYDQKQVPQFVYGITLNTIVSILAVFSKSSLLVAVTGALSELKWQWFRDSRSRSIIDMQLFDDASRGPWGSMILLATPHSWSLASLGALVYVLALAFDPFAQQLLAYPVRPTVAANYTDLISTLSRAETYAWAAGSERDIAEGLKLRACGWTGVWSPTDEATDFAQTQCPTGNCVWDEYESLSFCTQCRDITSGTNLTDATFFFKGPMPPKADVEAGSFPNKTFQVNSPADLPCDVDAGHITGNISVQENSDPDQASTLFQSLSSSPDWTHNGTGEHWRYRPEQIKYTRHLFQSLPGAIQGPGLMRICHVELQRSSHADTDELSVKQATLCELTPCVRKYSFSVKDGVPSLNTTGSRYGSWYYNATGSEFINGQLVNATSLEPVAELLLESWGDIAGKNEAYLDLANSTKSIVPFRVDNGGLLAFAFSFVRMFQGWSLEQNAIYNYSGTGTTYPASADLRFDSKFFSGENDDGLNLDAVQSEFDPGLTGVISQTATINQVLSQGGLTAVVPRIAAHLNNFVRTRENIPVTGRSYISVAFVEVRWPWIALPVVTWTLGMCFVLLSMWVCRGSKPLWKNSSLPLVYHGFDATTLEDIGAGADHLDYVSGMENSARTVRATLGKDSVDGQLKLRRTFDGDEEST